MSSIKCPQCGLVNFATDENCKRCGAEITKVAEAIEQTNVERAAAARHLNLYPCPDCEHMISRYAEACPSCGRFIQRMAQTITINRSGWSGTIAWGVILSWLLPILLFIMFIMVTGVLLSPYRR
jgi:predicted RNA-binding Zn-ribbon protein involved in translation (DUF1610 family)